MLLNTVNGMKYIGCSGSYSKRQKDHLNSLKANKHNIQKMQKDYNLGHGFEFTVLEIENNKKIAFGIETKYIRKFKNKIYNINECTEFQSYNTHIPAKLWNKIEKDLKRNPQLNDRRNSYNRIICKALNEYFDKGN